MTTLVLGAALSGRAAARLARDLGSTVIVYDQRSEALTDLDHGLKPLAGRWHPDMLRNVDEVIASPGFPEHSGPVADVLAAGIPLVSEMEYAIRQINGPYGAITGTNGKTTVTSVAADMLSASGIHAMAAGNIGTALSDVVREPPTVLVIEASSFQLRFVDQFHPRAAAILNIAPDHLDWHSDMAEYIAAKQRIFENQDGNDILVYDVDDAGATAAVVDARAQLIPVSGHQAPSQGYGPVGDLLMIGEHEITNPRLDPAYTMDLVAAGVVAAHLGATGAGIAETVAAFRPGEHRRSVVGTWDNVTWVNDSKATNPHAAVAAVAAYESVVLIAGGRNKGLDLAPVVAGRNLRHIVGLGEAAAELRSASPPDRFTSAASLAEAIAIADATARSGDTVLLAPGCASFDMFESYAARGREFARLVLATKGEIDGK